MKPTFNDYVALIYNRFEAFIQASNAAEKTGRPVIYQQKSLLVFFMWMQLKGIRAFKTQHEWLEQHPEALEVLNWQNIPHRVTLSRRYKQLYPVIVDFMLYQAQMSGQLGNEMGCNHLCEDKSLFKAHGNVWHQADREQGRIPPKLRNLDQDATWSKSAYHGWVYGYGLHLTCNQDGFPVLLQVETATYSETSALDSKELVILQQLKPDSVCGDDAYTQAMRIRHWATQGVILIAPALRWVKGRFAQAYHQFIRQPDIALRLRTRKTTIEPIFDLIGKLIGVTGKQKQLAVQRLAKVRTHLALATLTLQVAMIANSIWNLPFRNISTIRGAFA